MWSQLSAQFCEGFRSGWRHFWTPLAWALRGLRKLILAISR